MTQRTKCVGDGGGRGTERISGPGGPGQARSVTNKISTIVRSFTGRSEQSMTEIAQFADLPLSTAYRLLSDLVDGGVLERGDNGRYHIGAMLRQVAGSGGPAEEHRFRIGQTLEDLEATTGSRARFGVLHGALGVSYLERSSDMRGPCVPGLMVLPAHATALGKAILAYAPSQTVDRILQRGPLRRGSPTAAADEQFDQELSAIRQRGLAVSAGRGWHQPQMCALAAPVFGPHESVVGAVELAIADIRSGARSAGPALLVAARGLSRWFAESACRLPAEPDLAPPPWQTDSAGAAGRMGPDYGSGAAV
jgi:IclR family transcriptional regulator, acetate operon repressor